MCSLLLCLEMAGLDTAALHNNGSKDMRCAVTATGINGEQERGSLQRARVGEDEVEEEGEGEGGEGGMRGRRGGAP